jgi:hypothetical protein
MMTQMCVEHDFSTKTNNLPPQTLNPKYQFGPISSVFFTFSAI